jgi:uncharacterized lipoprotein
MIDRTDAAGTGAAASGRTSAAMLKRLVLLSLLAAGLAGCASDPRYKQGLEWVQWQEAERQRLEAAGFPQYSWP